MIEVSQPGGEIAVVCSERCSLIGSQAITVAREWAVATVSTQQPEISLVDRSAAVHCIFMGRIGACPVAQAFIKNRQIEGATE